MEGHITVKITHSQIRTMLAAIIGSASANSQLLAKVICDNLAGTEIGMDNLYLALNGVETKFKYRVGETIQVNRTSCYSWKVDFDKMNSLGLMTNDKVRAEIVKIHPYKRQPYEITYQYYSKDNEEIQTQNGLYIDEEAITPYDGYPLED